MGINPTDPPERALLHARARAFIRAAAEGGALPESFDALGLAILRYQAERVTPYARLLAGAGCHPDRAERVRALPAVPTDAFRLARIAAHPPAEDVALFRTSGTTGAARGEHPLSTTETYAEGALASGRWALFFDAPRPLVAIVLAPAPPPSGAPESSLHFMMHLFAARFASSSHFLQAAPDAPIDERDLRRACDEARAAGAPVALLGTSFSFVHVLDALRGARLPLPPGSRAMHTGGFKGRSREVEPAALRAEIAAAFGLREAAIVGEYGMTELSSQLYEGTLRASAGDALAAARPGLFLAPPWLRVAAADPDTLLPLPAGETGILRFEDLANVDSALVIQTADRGRVTAEGVELLGRARGAPPRGCSLAVEELLAR